MTMVMPMMVCDDFGDGNVYGDDFNDGDDSGDDGGDYHLVIVMTICDSGDNYCN